MKLVSVKFTPAIGWRVTGVYPAPGVSYKSVQVMRHIRELFLFVPDEIHARPGRICSPRKLMEV